MILFYYKAAPAVLRTALKSDSSADAALLAEGLQALLLYSKQKEKPLLGACAYSPIVLSRMNPDLRFHP